MIFFLLCLSVHSVRLIEYKFWKYYGQIIPDTSSNYKHAVNGLNITKDPSDCLYSDRGLYFSHQNSSLRLPYNDQVQSIDRIPTPYTVIMWILNFNTSGRYFNRWMDQQYYTILSKTQGTIGISIKTINNYGFYNSLPTQLIPGIN